MPSGPVDRNRFWEEVRQSLSQHVASLEEEFSREIGQREQDLSFLAHFAHDLLLKETQEEILTLLLDGAQRFAPRVVLFVAREDRFVGWSSRGYSETTAQQISESSFHQSESRLLMGALAADVLDSASDISLESALLRLIRNEAPAPWHAFPLKAIQKPLAVLLAAPEAGRNCNLESLSIMMDVTGLRIENLALKVLPEIIGATTAAPSKPHEEPPAEEVASASPAAAVEEPPPQESVEAARIDTVVSAAAQASPTWTAAEEEALAEALQESPIAPPPVVEEAPREPTEEDKLHSEAKRFARLLVSEIKLYNEQRVAEGRRNKDLYRRLQRDIDRSREMYEKRVSPLVSSSVDYFHHELIRILGDNDPSALGADYPGSRTES